MLTSLISVLPQTSHVPSVLPGSLWHFSSPHTFPRLCLLFLSLFKPPTLSLPPQELLAENFTSHLTEKIGASFYHHIYHLPAFLSVCVLYLPSCCCGWTVCLLSKANFAGLHKISSPHALVSIFLLYWISTQTWCYFSSQKHSFLWPHI